MATVYLAKEISLNREVALKVSCDAGNEARTMASLDHEHIVKVYSESVDSARGLRLICMQYVAGVTLSSLWQNIEEKARQTKRKGDLLSGQNILGCLDSAITHPTLFSPAAVKDREALGKLNPVGVVAWMGVRLADALAHAHQSGIVHFDVKPANILINSYGRPLLTDFNVATNKREQGQCLLGGTPEYMSPEQREAFQTRSKSCFARLDHRSDLYSLGLVLHEWLDRTQVHGTCEQSLRRILSVCLRENPEDRFADAAALSQALLGHLEHQGILGTLPKVGGFTHFALTAPVSALIISAFVPQLGGTIINISYNALRIVRQLTTPQQELFVFLCFTWNTFAYSICTGICIWKAFPVIRFLRDPEKTHLKGKAELKTLRRNVLHLPFVILLLAAAGWGGGAIFFPLSLHVLRGPLTAKAAGHFLISFALSSLVAATYSFLCLQFFCLRIVYPKLWSGETDIRKQAAKELTVVGQRARLFCYLAGLIPLFAASLLVFSAADNMEVTQYQIYRYFVALLIGLGMLGFGSALEATKVLSKTLLAFASNESS